VFGNVSWRGGEASEGRESLIMNRSPTLAVRRCYIYVSSRQVDHPTKVCISVS